MQGRRDISARQGKQSRQGQGGKGGEEQARQARQVTTPGTPCTPGAFIPGTTSTPGTLDTLSTPGAPGTPSAPFKRKRCSRNYVRTYKEIKYAKKIIETAKAAERKTTASILKVEAVGTYAQCIRCTKLHRLTIENIFIIN